MHTRGFSAQRYSQAGAAGTGHVGIAALETLEPRLFLSATLSNGLPTGDPGYFDARVDSGGYSEAATFGGVDENPIYEYSAFLEIGGEVFSLSDHGSSAVLQDGIAVSEGSFSLTAGGQIAFRVESRVLHGLSWLINSYAFTTSGEADLRQATFWQYLDSDIYSVGDDVLRVSGGVAGADLVLTTVDPPTHLPSLKTIFGLPRMTELPASRYSIDMASCGSSEKSLLV